MPAHRKPGPVVSERDLVVHLDKLSPEKRKRVEKALSAPRDTQVALKFRAVDVKAWRAFAERSKMTLTEMIERGIAKLISRRT